MTPTRKKIALGALVAVLVGAFAVWFFLIRDTAPESFALDSAANAAENTDTTDGDQPSEAGPFDPVGAWEVDGDFVADDGTQSEAGYRVNEELKTVGEKTVVGRTPDVSGTLTIEGTAVTEATFVVQMATVKTDSGSRDSRYRSAVDSANFPTSTFELTEPIELGSLPADGESISATAIGNLTVKGTTNAVELELEAVVTNGRLVVVGSTPVLFSDYGVETPSAAIVVSLDDQGVMEFQLFFAKV